MGLPAGGKQRNRERWLPAGQRGQALRRQRLRCDGDRRIASVLGRQPTLKDGGPNEQGRCPQTSCQWHPAAEINSVEVTHAYRSRLVAQQPKVDTGTFIVHSNRRSTPAPLLNSDLAAAWSTTSRMYCQRMARA